MTLSTAAVAHSKRVVRKGPSGGLSERTKKILLITSLCLLVIVTGWWAYFKFTTISPPDLKALGPADVDTVVDYYGSSRGLIRLPVARQEQYLAAAYQKFGQGDDRARYMQALGRMSSGEREMLHSALFEITRVHVMESAREYNNLPASQRGAFIDNAIRKMEGTRGELGGNGQATNLGEPLKAGLPTSSDEIMKVLVTRTNGQERAEAQPFVDKMAERYKELKNPDARRRFDEKGK